jgi:hypothetical protein
LGSVHKGLYAWLSKANPGVTMQTGTQNGPRQFNPSKLAGKTVSFLLPAGIAETEKYNEKHQSPILELQDRPNHQTLRNRAWQSSFASF